MPATPRVGRLRTLSVGLVAALTLAACGGGGGSSGDAQTATLCGLAERLTATADGLLEADVADPDAFETALDAAVLEYTTTLDSLRDVVPESLVGDVEEVRGLVEQERFDEAADARADLDAYIESQCGSSAPTTPTT